MPTTFCRHIRANGTRCNSPALRGQPLCYFHHRDRQRYPNLRPAEDPTPTVIHSMQRDPGGMQRDPLIAQYFSDPPLNHPAELHFPPLEDRESIQVALSMLLAALGRNQLEPKRAGMMLYGLQVASSNAKTLTHNAPETVTEVLLDDHGHELAPDEDPAQPDSAPNSIDLLLRELEEEFPE